MAPCNFAEYVHDLIFQKLITQVGYRRGEGVLFFQSVFSCIGNGNLLLDQNHTHKSIVQLLFLSNGKVSNFAGVDEVAAIRATF